MSGCPLGQPRAEKVAAGVGCGWRLRLRRARTWINNISRNTPISKMTSTTSVMVMGLVEDVPVPPCGGAMAAVRKSCAPPKS